MKLRRFSAILASSFFPCCFLCLLHSCQPSLHVSTSHTLKLKNKEIATSWKGSVSISCTMTFDCASNSKTGFRVKLVLTNCCVESNRDRLLSTVLQVVLNSHSLLLQSWTGITPFPNVPVYLCFVKICFFLILEELC